MLRQHPNVCAPLQKELHFFNKTQNYQRGIEWYRSHFSGCTGQDAVDEFTVNYFWTSDDSEEIRRHGLTRDIPGLIHTHYPDLRLILVLRNPVDRAISAFYHHIAMRRFSPSTRLLDVMDRFGILSMGYYDEHLDRWWARFDPRQFLILIYETDIVDCKQDTVRCVYRFLGVADSFRPQNVEKRYNPRRSRMYMYFNYYAPVVSRVLFAVFPSLRYRQSPWQDPELGAVKQILHETYNPHNTTLSQMLGRELPW